MKDKKSHLSRAKLIALLILMLFCTANSFAQSFTVDGIKYNITDANLKTVVVGSYNTTTLSKLTIPKTVKNNDIEYTVTGIGSFAFVENESLTSIEIPESVTNIGEFAFSGCSSLTSIEIPSSVTSIELHAFGACSSLTSFKIPNGVTSIGDAAFRYCTNLISIEIPESVTSIGENAFSECSSLESIDIPESVTSIGESAFYDCKKLTSINISESVTSIGNYAFYGCENLTSIKLNWEEDVILKFNSDWGMDLHKVTLYVPDGEKENYQKKDWVCNNTQSMLKVTLLVNNETFGKIEGDVNVIPDTKETYTAIPNDGYHFVKWSDDNTENPREITVSSNITLEAQFKPIFEFKYNENTKTAEVVDFNSEQTEIKIPEKVMYNGVEYTVTSIGEEAFAGCENLTSIEIPNSVTSIGNSAFEYCINLSSIKLNWDYPLDFNSNWEINTSNVTLYVPNGKSEVYKLKGWNGNIKEMLKVILKVNDETFGKIEGNVNVIPDTKETYTVIPNEHYHFVKWEDGNTENPLEITVTENFELKAIFAIDQHTITLKGDNGTFSGAGEYEYGKKVKIEAIPNTGYHFVKWSDDNTENPREIKVTKDLELEAIFEKDVPTAIKAVETENNKTIKTIKDGQIVIIRNGVMYDLQGRKL